MGMRVWKTGLVLLMVFGRIAFVQPSTASSAAMCPISYVTDSIFGEFRDSICPSNGDQPIRLVDSTGVMEGDEASLQRALHMVHKNSNDYVAVLFYASWCPFSGAFRPSFSILSTSYPSIPHFAIEESVVRPSILSKYGVHGFPTLFLLNSTMRVRYVGSRSLGSLVAFYNDITGMKAASLDGTSLDTTGSTSDLEKHNNNERESCPFSWAISPENLLQQETYLALATVFVLLRLLYFVFPAFCVCARFAWRRYILNIRLTNLWGLPVAFLNRAIQLFNSLKEPSKRSNLQEGAMNARAWASKSLASVSFGDTSTSRVVPVS